MDSKGSKECLVVMETSSNVMVLDGPRYDLGRNASVALSLVIVG